MSASSPVPAANPDKIVVFVTGSTGTVGQQVVKHLLNLPQSHLKLLVRDVAKAKALFPQAEHQSRLDFIQGDLENVASYQSELAKSDRAFLLSPGGEAPGRFQIVEGTFVSAAKAAGIKHLVKLSAEGATPAGAFDGVFREHWEAEKIIIDSGLRFTFLRPNFFMSNVVRQLDTIKQTGVYSEALPVSFEQALISPSDIGHVAARVLTDPIEKHHGRAYDLTGPESLAMTRQAEILSAFLGLSVQYQTMSDVDLFNYIGSLMGENVAHLYVRLFQETRVFPGFSSNLTGNVEILTGQKPESFEVFLSKLK